MKAIPAPPLTYSVTHAEFEDDGKLERLRAAFGLAWKRFPAKARKLLTQSWAANGGGSVLLGMEYPGFETGVAQCEPCGTRFAFHAVAFEDLPDDILDSVVGHELCHALLKFSGDPHHASLDSPETKSLREAATDAKMDEVGFSSDDLRRWVREYSRSLKYVNETWMKLAKSSRRRRLAGSLNQIRNKELG